MFIATLTDEAHEIEHEIVFHDTKRLQRREKLVIAAPIVAIAPIVTLILGLVVL